MNNKKCDCLSFCGDDPAIYKGSVEPCQDLTNSRLGVRGSRQRDILAWACQTFGTETAANTGERISRFAEESLELMQSAGMDKTAVLKLVDYVYSRPAGEIKQEIGQVGVSLLGYAEHLGISAEAEEQAEFNRIRSLPVEHWQSRQNAKAKKGIALVATPEESCGSFRS